MKTIETKEFAEAIHLAKLIPIGTKQQKRVAVRRWRDGIKRALAHG